MEAGLMLLCDIGNTSYHFYDGRADYREPAETFEPESLKERVYYVCVNPQVKARLDPLANWVDLAGYVDRGNYYDTMGIDRIMACEAVDEGVIVDAGSAITVDVVRGGRFEGGYIVPGLGALSEAYRRVSPRLDYSFDFELHLDKMPKNSRDAVTYGAVGLLARDVRSCGLPVCLTGGDAPKLLPLFPGARHDPLLLFAGMRKIIQKARPC